eukprot:XP_001693966.1 predicted protein [Chlamydomonas reinhardtii]
MHTLCCSWLLDTFGADYLSSGSGVLDVAGGKGELAFELLNLNSVPASVLDPRPMQLQHYVKRLQVVEAVGRLAVLQREGCGGASGNSTPEWGAAMAAATAAFLESRDRAKQVEWTCKGFAAAEGHEEEPTRVLPAGHWRQRREAAVGRRWRRLHAAEFAVRLAMAAGKPFALVPCCVYAAEFPRRKLRSGEQVRSYAQLLAYLQELGGGADGEVVARELPFEGKNVMLYRCSTPGAPDGGS